MSRWGEGNEGLSVLGNGSSLMSTGHFCTGDTSLLHLLPLLFKDFTVCFYGYLCLCECMSCVYMLVEVRIGWQIWNGNYRSPDICARNPAQVLWKSISDLREAPHHSLSPTPMILLCTNQVSAISTSGLRWPVVTFSSKNKQALVSWKLLQIHCPQETRASKYNLLFPSISPPPDWEQVCSVQLKSQPLHSIFCDKGQDHYLTSGLWAVSPRSIEEKGLLSATGHCSQHHEANHSTRHCTTCSSNVSMVDY